MLLAGYVLTMQIDLGDAWMNAVDPRKFTVTAHKECAWNEELLRSGSDVTDLKSIVPEEAAGKKCEICEKLLTEKVYYDFQAVRLVYLSGETY
jgi:hypothetical protein